MQHPATSGLDAALSREVALREGINAVVTGEIASVGPQVVISARLIVPSTGELLAARRETARDSTEIMPAVDRVSKKLREKIGESFTSLRAEQPLEQVTTGSLPALRKYSQAMRWRVEDDHGAIALLEEAVALDTSFAMAYRALGTIFARRDEPARAAEAFTRAFRYRDRLTERDRYHTAASYFWEVTSELEKARATYSALLDNYPDDRGALNNLGAIYMDDMHQDARAEPLFRRLVAMDSTDWGRRYQSSPDPGPPRQAA